MTTHRAALLAAASLAAAAMVAAPMSALAQADSKLKIGLMLTLSGPPAALGDQARKGFELAVKQLGGKLGGREAEVIVVDDELKPDVAVTKVKGLIERDKVDFVVGPIFSNIAGAIHKPVTAANTFLISPNAGPSPLAGRGCSPFFFATSYQNDGSHETMGAYAQSKGYKRVILLTPNYQAGKDSMAGFKRFFKGEVIEEIFVPLGQLDFQAELAKIASAKPDALFTFMPGGMGVNLVRQFRQAGLAETVPFLSAFTVDESTLPATQDAAVGFVSGMTWAPNVDNPQSKAFVAAYEAAYGAVPGSYAMQAYDAAKLIDSAVKSVKGDLSDPKAVTAALRKADFASLRGKFKFGTNHFPVQDYYVVTAAKRADGKFQTQIGQRVFTDHVDAYAGECKMPY